MVCIYHSKDLDGYTSGAIIKRKFPDIKLIGYDYGDEIPWNQIEKDEPVIMVDVSLKVPEMIQLAQHTGGQLTWIDHHISKMKEYELYLETNEPFMDIVFNNNIAACEVAWGHYFPDEELPLAVNLIGIYDTYRKEDTYNWEKEVLPFQYGMRTVCNSPETFPIFLFDNPPYLIDEISRTGKIILDYQTGINNRLCQSRSFEAEFAGLRAICLNANGVSSEVFKTKYDMSKHDVMLIFSFDGEWWDITIYTASTTLDCSEIAKQRGGGGHKQASGFRTKDINSVLKGIL